MKRKEFLKEKQECIIDINVTFSRDCLFRFSARVFRCKRQCKCLNEGTDTSLRNTSGTVSVCSGKPVTVGLSRYTLLRAHFR